MKWSWAGHIDRIKDDRSTWRVTTWRPYDKTRRQGRPAERWRYDLDTYWSDTIWQRTAPARVTWRRLAEAFAQPRDTRLPNNNNKCVFMTCVCVRVCVFMCICVCVMCDMSNLGNTKKTFGNYYKKKGCVFLELSRVNRVGDLYSSTSALSVLIIHHTCYMFQ